MRGGNQHEIHTKSRVKTIESAEGSGGSKSGSANSARDSVTEGERRSSDPSRVKGGRNGRIGGKLGVTSMGFLAIDREGSPIVSTAFGRDPVATQEG